MTVECLMFFGLPLFLFSMLIFSFISSKILALIDGLERVRPISYIAVQFNGVSLN